MNKDTRNIDLEVLETFQENLDEMLKLKESLTEPCELIDGSVELARSQLAGWKELINKKDKK